MAEAKIERLLRRYLMLWAAGIVALAGFGMLDAAIYLALRPIVGPARSAAIVAGLCFLLAGLFVTIGSIAKPRSKLRKPADFPRAVSDKEESIEAEVAALLLPLVSAIVRSFRKSKADRREGRRTESFP